LGSGSVDAGLFGLGELGGGVGFGGHGFGVPFSGALTAKTIYPRRKRFGWGCG
jgi:hypothetical protein